MAYRNEWSENDLLTLQRCYPHDDLDLLSKQLGRTRKSLLRMANKKGVSRYNNQDRYMSYTVRLIRASDGVVFYERHISKANNSKSMKNSQIEEWNRMHGNKIRSGEWQLSIINGFENY